MNCLSPNAIRQFHRWRTPFYYYDLDLLQATLDSIGREVEPHPHFEVHYAVKACAHPAVLAMIKDRLGADCVSGGEIKTCLAAGFPADRIVYAGVGKADWEIRLALKAGIEYFNVESLAELEVIDITARRLRTVAKVCFRINPDVGAHTHSHITTGLAENKFGISMDQMENAILRARELECIEWVGLHFHIGSQILEMDDFVQLCHRINELQDRLERQGMPAPRVINVGGGLGVDYEHPEDNAIPDFASYFHTFATHLRVRPGQKVHFELGRAVVAQCGSLVTRCLYVKHTEHKEFLIVDAGMTDLIRPALYGAYHFIENLDAKDNTPTHTYDVVGPICESSDVFGKDRLLHLTRRSQLLAIRSAGAYGQVMASQYNCRMLPTSHTSRDLQERARQEQAGCQPSEGEGGTDNCGTPTARP